MANAKSPQIHAESVIRRAAPIFTPENSLPTSNWVPLEYESNPLRHLDLIGVDSSLSNGKKRAQMLMLVDELYPPQYDARPETEEREV